MEQLVWSPGIAMGLGAIDDAHQALREALWRVMRAPDREFAAELAVLVEAIEHDFREEEDLMEAIGFPALKSHREQHARMLGALHSVALGDCAQQREVVERMAQWFEFHMATMDAALVAVRDWAELAGPRKAGGRGDPGRGDPAGPR